MDHEVVIVAPMTGIVVDAPVRPGENVYVGQELFVIESMKMHHPVVSEDSGRLRSVAVEVGTEVVAGTELATVIVGEEAGQGSHTPAEPPPRIDLTTTLSAFRTRITATRDEARPTAVAQRHAHGLRMARENLEDLCDEGSFIEYGSLVLAAQRRRRTLEELVASTPADGLICGTASINAAAFGAAAARCVVMAYDYTVLAGTQGFQNHRKKDRIFDLAGRDGLPVVMYVEGGGGRPGDTDVAQIAGLDVPAFHLLAALSGRVPIVSIVSGRSFAGNAALAGISDVIIATRGANLGMGGPAVVEGGGLGTYRPEEIGPMEVQWDNGVIDVLVDNEAEGTSVAKQYLAYFQGDLPQAEERDQSPLRELIPVDRLRPYKIRDVITTLVDEGSFLELRGGWGRNMVTGLARVRGRSIGIVANSSEHLGGAIDARAADKAARFMRLCDAFGLPIISLCDTPGIMVGPDAESEAIVRHSARLFLVGGRMRTPLICVVTRKAYGLGAMAMAGGSFRTPRLTVSWPSGEFGGMGLEGAARLGYRRELEAISDDIEREAAYRHVVDNLYEQGRAVSAASYFEFDEVIDPADTRSTISAVLEGYPRLRRWGQGGTVDSW